MSTQIDHRLIRERAEALLDHVGIVLTARERAELEVADFGLGRPERVGLELITYVNNDRYCAKELVLLPRQTCPEHRHPPVDGRDGKMETFRCRWGRVWLYVEGAPTAKPAAHLPEIGREHYTVFHQIELGPGEQFTIPPNVRHWFQAGDSGAVVSEFSSTSRDDRDQFTDPNVRRV